MLARSVSDLPTGNKEWLYEIKLDGYRCLIGKSSNKVTLWSRRGNTFTTQFPLIAQAGNGLEPDTLIDGEIVAIDDDGRVSFNLLQHHRSKAQAIQFYAFDLLIYKGRSLSGVALETRRELLTEALSTVGDPIRISEAFETTPADLIRAAKEQSLEGIVAKRNDSLYEPGKRSGAWLKYRINRSQELSSAAIHPTIPLMR
jgi:ATP-dependent DNA ligase